MRYCFPIEREGDRGLTTISEGVQHEQPPALLWNVNTITILENNLASSMTVENIYTNESLQFHFWIYAL
jgi:hypothetical protein